MTQPSSGVLPCKDWDVQKSDRREGSHSTNGGPVVMGPQPQDRDHSPVPISNSGTYDNIDTFFI